MASVGDTIRGASSAAGIIPGWGTAIAGLGTIAGGIADMFTAKKQKEQAENLRKQTMAMKPLPLQKEQLQKLDATKFAALAGLPTYELYKNALNEQGAQSLRNIRQTAPTGSAALEATTAVNMAQNAALNDLAAKDALAKLELQKEARTAMGEVGALKDAQRLRTDKLQMAGLEQVSKLENAATYNRTLGLKNIAGALGKGGAALAAMYSKNPATQTTTEAQPAATGTTATTETPEKQSLITGTAQSDDQPFEQNSITPTEDIQGRYDFLLKKGKLTPKEMSELSNYSIILSTPQQPTTGGKLTSQQQQETTQQGAENKLTPQEQQEYDTLIGMPYADMTDAQMKRLVDLIDKKDK